jgi:hypothetical protein
MNEMRNRREMEDNKSVPVGSPIGQNETASSAYSLILKMEGICSSETSADFQRATWGYIAAGNTLFAKVTLGLL